ncbi:MAG: electron transport complex subunit RsxC [Spartobacteria bacterium]|nr:electron transport complex subunit RsxC [Spartobacteria bacterium]
MTKVAVNYPGKGTFERGIHPPEMKQWAEDKSISVLPTPKELYIPLLQHVGAPAKLLVAPKEQVVYGQVIAEAGGFISAPIHSPVAGVVGRGANITLANGRHVPMVPVVTASDSVGAADGIYEDMLGGEWPLSLLDDFSPEEIVDKIKQAGIVGQGGAAFPTFVKVLKNKDKPVDALVINGCECEPYLTADHRVMLEAPQAVIAGTLLAAKASGAKAIYIAVESNKMDAVEALRPYAQGTAVTLAVVETRYPMGGEKQTVRAVTGRTIPTGGLPLDVGVVVMNVSTTWAVARAVLRGKPLTHRVITVTGRGIAEPKNVLAPVGVPLQELIDFCGGLKADTARIIAGGPMMGFTVGNLKTPVTKGTSGITVMTLDDVHEEETTHCVRCGRCVDVCPLNLIPTKMALAAKNKDWELAKKYHIGACMECGCCAYSCPANIPLVQLIRMGKVQMLKK